MGRSLDYTYILLCMFAHQGFLPIINYFFVPIEINILNVLTVLLLFEVEGIPNKIQRKKCFNNHFVYIHIAEYLCVKIILLCVLN